MGSKVFFLNLNAATVIVVEYLGRISDAHASMRHYQGDMRVICDVKKDLRSQV